MTADEYFALNQANAQKYPTTQVKQNVWTPDYASDYQRRYGTPYAQNMSQYRTDPKSGNRFVKTGAILGALGAGGVFGAGLAAGGAAAGAGAGTASALPSTTSGIGTTAGYGSLFGGGGAASSGAASSSVAPAAAAGSKFSLGTLLKFGVPLVTNYLGQRSQNKSFDKQMAMEQATLQQQIEMAREQEAYRRQEAMRVAAEEQRRWEIEQANLAKQLAAQEEERAYQRAIAEAEEGRRKARDSRRDNARIRLDEFLRRGRG